MHKRKISRILAGLMVFCMVVTGTPYGSLSVRANGDGTELTGENQAGTGEVVQGIAIDEQNFPDSNFRLFVSEKIDLPNGNGEKDGVLSANEIAAVESIDLLVDAVPGQGKVQSLAGVENFKNLKRLLCCKQSLTSLSISGLPELVDLDCNGNNLESLDFSGHEKIKEINCSGNPLTSLTVANNPSLTFLNCSATLLKNLDLRNNVKVADALIYGEKYQDFYGLDSYGYWECSVIVDRGLNILYSADVTIPIDEEHFPDAAFRTYVCQNIDKDKDNVLSVNEIKNVFTINVAGAGWNNKGTIRDLTGIDHFKKLIYINCDYNQVTTLDLSGIGNLQELSCIGNTIKSLDVSNNSKLSSLICYSCGLEELKIGRYNSLKTIMCMGNRLESLDLSKCTALESLQISGNQIGSLDVSKCPKLNLLSCEATGLSVLDVSGNPQLERLSCGSNQLTTLNLNNNTKLIYLKCEGNKIQQMDVSACATLSTLICDNNVLQALDIRNCPMLTYLTCSQNAITELDLRNNTKLSQTECYKNPISKIDLRGNQKLIDLVKNGTRSLISNNTIARYDYNNAIFVVDAGVELITEDPPKTLDMIADEVSEAIEADGTVEEKVASLKEDYEADTLAEVMLKNDNALVHIMQLEEQYAQEKNITTGVEVADAVKNVIAVDKVSVIGAAMNVEAGNVKLEISSPAELKPVEADYENSVQIDIKLVAGNEEQQNLDIPVRVTIPIPEGIDMDKLVIVHYANDGTSEVVKIQDKDRVNRTVSFVLTHFSTFLLANVDELPDATVKTIWAEFKEVPLEDGEGMDYQPIEDTLEISDTQPEGKWLFGKIITDGKYAAQKEDVDYTMIINNAYVTMTGTGRTTFPSYWEMSGDSVVSFGNMVMTSQDKDFPAYPGDMRTVGNDDVGEIAAFYSQFPYQDVRIDDFNTTYRRMYDCTVTGNYTVAEDMIDANVLTIADGATLTLAAIKFDPNDTNEKTSGGMFNGNGLVLNGTIKTLPAENEDNPPLIGLYDNGFIEIGQSGKLDVCDGTEFVFGGRVSGEGFALYDWPNGWPEDGVEPVPYEMNPDHARESYIWDAQRGKWIRGFRMKAYNSFAVHYDEFYDNHENQQNAKVYVNDELVRSDEEKQFTVGQAIRFKLRPSDERKGCVPVVEIEGGFGRQCRLWATYENDPKWKINLTKNEAEGGYDFTFTPVAEMGLEVRVLWSDYDALRGDDEQFVLETRVINDWIDGELVQTGIITVTPAAQDTMNEPNDMGGVKRMFDRNAFKDSAYAINVTFAPAQGYSIYAIGTDFEDGEDWKEYVTGTPGENSNEVSIQTRVGRGFTINDDGTITATIAGEQRDSQRRFELRCEAVRRSITVEGGNASANTAEAERGRVVDLNVDQIPEGKKFDGWEVVSGDVTIDDPTAEHTFFHMGTQDVVIRANWKDDASQEAGMKVNTWGLPTKYRLDSGEWKNLTEENGELRIPKSELEGAQQVTLKFTATEHENPLAIAYRCWEGNQEFYERRTLSQDGTYTFQKGERWRNYEVEVVTWECSMTGEYQVNPRDKESLTFTDESNRVVRQNYEFKEGDTLSFSFAEDICKVLVIIPFDEQEVIIPVNNSFTYKPHSDRPIQFDVFTEEEAYEFDQFQPDHDNGEFSANFFTHYKQAEGVTGTVTWDKAPIRYRAYNGQTRLIYKQDEVTQVKLTIAPGAGTTYTIRIQDNNGLDEDVTDAVQANGNVYVWNVSEPWNVPRVNIDFQQAMYSIQVEGGNANTPNAEMGRKVDLSASQPPEGMVFDKWEVVSGGVTIDNPTAENTSFTMGTENVSIKATWKKVEERDPAIMNSALATFEGKIGVVYRLELPDYVREDPKAYVSFLKNGKESRMLVSAADTEVVKGKTVYRFTKYVVAKEYRENINLRLFDGNGNPVTLKGSSGKDYTETGVDYSLETYIGKKKDSTDEKMAALAVALEDYCTAAQIYFEYNATGLVVSDRVKAVTADDLEIYKGVFEGDMPAGMKNRSINVAFESDNTFKLLYTYDENVDPKGFTYAINDKAATLYEDNGQYYLMTANVAAKNLDKVSAYTITKNGVTYTVKCSVLTYARSSVKNGTEARQNLGKSLYLYNQAAIAYFTK